MPLGAMRVGCGLGLEPSNRNGMRYMDERTLDSRKSVLIVDDDTDICLNLKDILDDLGYRSEIANDGPAALRLLSQQRYDIALLDFKMPLMDGASLYREVRERSPETLAIMITAHAGHEGMIRAPEAPTWKILRKPVDLAKLLSLIQQCNQKGPERSAPGPDV